MAVEDWHPGKILLFWLTALGLGAVGFRLAAWMFDATSYDGNTVEIFLFTCWSILFFGSVAITWRWLGGRERAKADRIEQYKPYQ